MMAALHAPVSRKAEEFKVAAPPQGFHEPIDVPVVVVAVERDQIADEQIAEKWADSDVGSHAGTIP